MDIDEYIDKGLIHSIHTSERRAFRGCRRRWDWSYRKGYHPTITAKPLEFGIAYHVAMETWYDPEAWRFDRDIQSKLAIHNFKKTVYDQYTNYVELNGIPEDLVIEDYNERIELGVAMVEYYTKKVSPILDKGLTPLAVEIPFEVYLGFMCKCTRCWKLWHGTPEFKEDWAYKNEILGCETQEAYRKSFWSGLPVTFGGRIDAIMQDEEGRVFCFDWKTTTKILDDFDEAAFLELDDQVAGYPVALRKLGRRVDGFIYHEQRKAVPQPPKQLQREYKGKIFSTDKSAPVEYDVFLNTVMNKDLRAYNMGLYDDYLDYLQGALAPKFYQRHSIIKTEIQINNFWQDLRSEAKDMLRDPSIYPQPSRFSCNSCLYRVPCDGQNRGEDYIYTLNTLFVGNRP